MLEEKEVRGHSKHSVKLPYLYKEASKVIKAYHEKKGSLKSLVYATRCDKLWRRLLAVVSMTTDHAAAVDRALSAVGVLSSEPGLDPCTARVLTAELLFGSGQLRSQARPVLTILRHADALRDAAAGETETTRQTPTRLPRYVRINTLLIEESDVLQQLTNEGYQLVDYPDHIEYDTFINKIKGLSSGQFLRDLHVPSLLVFPPATEFHLHPLYKSGKLILQDKASCLPATVLAPRRGEHVLDACAAPGMKTSQLAALMHNTGTVVAVERDRARFQTLSSMLRRSGVNNTRLVCADFLKLSPQQHPQVTAILLDPSCSGTGMVGREQESVPQDRLQRLSNLQGMLLRHALSFPNVTRVVYSTCSVTEEENEQVVSATLKSHPGWRLGDARPATWRACGRSWLAGGDRCVRASSEGDLCHGFFVSLFVRDGTASLSLVEKEDGVQVSKKKRKKKKSSRDGSSASGGLVRENSGGAVEGSCFSEPRTEERRSGDDEERGLDSSDAGAKQLLPVATVSSVSDGSCVARSKKRRKLDGGDSGQREDLGQGGTQRCALKSSKTKKLGKRRRKPK